MRWFVLCLLCLLFLSCTQQEPFFNVGVHVDNEYALDGMKLAAQEVNQRDFLLSPLRLIVQNCADSAEELIAAYGVRVIIDGCPADSVTRAAQHNGVTVVRLYGDASVFSMMPSHELMDVAAADVLFKNGYRKLGVLHSRNITIFMQEFERFGGVVFDEHIEPHASANVPLTRLRARMPDALFIVDSNLSISHIPEPVIRYDGYTGIDEQVIRPTSTEVFRTYFHRVHDKEPSYDTALGYDAVKAIAEALREQPHTGKGIHDGLVALSFDGATGQVDFDEQGKRVGDVPVALTR